MIVRLCDICENPARIIYFDIKRELDAAGASDSVTETVDLCSDCIASEYIRRLHDSPCDIQSSHLKDWRRLTAKAVMARTDKK